MNGDTTSELQDLIERLRRGDQTARRAVLERALHRVRRIAGKVLHEDYPDLRGRHDLTSVVDETWMRLLRALETTEPETVDEFFGLVFKKVREVLLDLLKRQKRIDGVAIGTPRQSDATESALPPDRADTTHEPVSLAIWTEFHDEVERLPHQERLVFDLRYYCDWSQAEIAQVLSLPPKKVSRLWLTATGRLAKWLKETEALV